MARIRTIKPEFWKSESIAALSKGTRLTFIGLWTYVDDNGVGIDNPKLVTAELYPLEDDPREALANVREDLATLEKAERIYRYTVNGKSYLEIVNWSEHQKIDRPGKARYPDSAHPDAVVLGCENPQDLPPIRHPLDESSRESRATPSPGAGNREQGAGEQGTVLAPQAAPEAAASPRQRGTRIPIPFPVTPEMVAWAVERVPDIDGRTETEKFTNHWKAKTGKDATKLDWPATWRNWMLNAHQRAPARAPAGGLQERNGVLVSARTAESVDLVERFKAREAATSQSPLAIEGVPR